MPSFDAFLKMHIWTQFWNHCQRSKTEQEEEPQFYLLGMLNRSLVLQLTQRSTVIDYTKISRLVLIFLRQSGQFFDVSGTTSADAKVTTW